MIINLPKLHDGRGNLTVIEKNIIPFTIERVYYLYDVPRRVSRARHAHKTLERFLIAVSGSFDVELTSRDGIVSDYHLVGGNRGLYIPPKVWSEINNFSPGAICLVLASDNYDESDYIRDFNQWKGQ